LKENLGKAFEVKDLGPLRYFLGIKIARSPKGIVLSERKYVLDLLIETGMLGCRPCSTPIDKNHQITAECGDSVNKETYQRLIGKLIYLCHTRPNISYAVSVVSRYMHDPRIGHMEIVYKILRYGTGRMGTLIWRATVMWIEQVAKMIGGLPLRIVCLWETISSHGEAKSKHRGSLYCGG